MSQALSSKQYGYVDRRDIVTSFEGERAEKRRMTNLDGMHHKQPRVFTVKNAFNMSAAAVERTATMLTKHLNQAINDLSS